MSRKKELKVVPRQNLAEELAKEAIWPTIMECFKIESDETCFRSNFHLEVIALSKNLVRVYYQKEGNMYCKTVSIPLRKLWKASAYGTTVNAKQLCKILCEIAPTMDSTVKGNIRDGLEETEKAVFDFYMNL